MATKQRECDLLPAARDLMSEKLGYDETNILEEIHSPWGRPDLIAFHPGPSPPVSESIVLSRTALSLMSVLRREGPMGLEQFASRLGLSKRSLLSSVDPLISKGMVRLRNQSLSPVPMSPESLGDISAVEIKTCNWRSGLRQAIRYKTFSDEVYLFLGRDVARIDLDAFYRSKVGLARLEPEPAILIEPTRVRNENVAFGRRLVEENIRRSFGRIA